MRCRGVASRLRVRLSIGTCATAIDSRPLPRPTPIRANASATSSMPRRPQFSTAGLLLWMACATTLAAAEPVSFDRDVMAVLSKAGCNFGACHANTNGKGGLKLSLRGEDPAGDYVALV